MRATRADETGAARVPMNRPMTGTVQCPGCGEPMARVVDGGVHYSCTRCRGRLVGLAPFEREHPADGRRLWVAAEDGAPAGTCPFCAGGLLAPDLDGTTPGIAVCRRCEQVWVPENADQRLAPVGAAPTETAARPLHPDRCPECGAPWAPDPAGRCRYCREQLSAADQPVVIIERDGAPGVGTGIATGVAAAALGIAEVLGIAERYGRG